MRIGIISYDFDPPIGGLGIVAKALVSSLRSLSPDTHFTSISPSEFSSERVSSLAVKRFRKSGGCPLFSFVLFFLLGQIIQRHALDLIHVHAGSGGVFLLRRPSSVPLVVTAHHTYRQEASLVYRRHPFRRLLKLCMSLLEQRTYKLADVITCVSQDTADALMSDYGVPPSKVTVIENGVAERFFLQPAPPRDPCRILFVGRLEERKGIYLLLSAFRRVLHDLPDARLELIGENLIGQPLLDYIEAHNLSSAVHCRGYVLEDERIASMVSATVIVIPSLLEGFGLICAEAMALSCPVLCSPAPGLRSLVVHGKTGLVVDPSGEEHFAISLLMLLRDSSLQASVGRLAGETARLRFRWSRAGESLWNVFNTVTRKK